MKNQIVSHHEWLERRRAFLAKEKQFTQARAALAKERQDLPWEKVEKTYTFRDTAGQVSLCDLFDSRRQLVVYHFMYGPDWEQGCPSCSYLADHFEPAVVHLNQRDVTLVAISRASTETIHAFKNRMGWTFPWVSSLDTDFNQDFHVSFSADEVASGGVTYNYARQPFPSTEAPGLSVFYRDEDDTLFHTYSCYARGLDPFITTYQYLDLVPKGRDEDGLDHTMSWVRHHDRYGQ